MTSGSAARRTVAMWGFEGEPKGMPLAVAT